MSPAVSKASKILIFQSDQTVNETNWCSRVQEIKTLNGTLPFSGADSGAVWKIWLSEQREAICILVFLIKCSVLRNISRC